MIPIVGTPFDLFSAGISAGRGDPVAASISLLAIVWNAGVARRADAGMDALKLSQKADDNAIELLLQQTSQAAIESRNRNAQNQLDNAIRNQRVTKAQVDEAVERLKRNRPHLTEEDARQAVEDILARSASLSDTQGVGTKTSEEIAPNRGATFFGRVVTPHIDDLSARTIRSFTDGNVAESVLQKDSIFYRVWDEKAGRVGSYVTSVKPTSRVQAMESLALDPAWNNSRVWISEVHVPAGVPIYEGTATAQGGLKGGGNQVFIPSDWLVDLWFQLPQVLR